VGKNTYRECLFIYLLAHNEIRRIINPDNNYETVLDFIITIFLPMTLLRRRRQLTADFPNVPIDRKN